MAQKTLKKLALIVAVSALCAGLSSCQKDADEKGGSITGGDGTITFGAAFEAPSQDLTVKGSLDLKDDEGNVVLTMEEATFDTPSPEQTKATLVNDVDAFVETFGGVFQVSGFQGKTTYQGIDNLPVTMQATKYPDGTEQWTLENHVSWPANTNLEFFAWSPAAALAKAPTLHPGESIPTANFDYTVTDALFQKDIMMAHYKGNGSNNDLGDSGAPVAGVATMEFSHALSSVSFKAEPGNSKLNGIKLNSISLESIGSEASCTASFGASTTYAWGTASNPLTYTKPFATPIDLYTDGLTPCEDGTTFIVIPQTFGNGSSARIVLNITCGGVDYNISYKLADGTRTTAWDAGETTIYTINYDDVEVTIDDEIISNVKQNLEITNTGGVKEYIRAVIVANWSDDEVEGLVVAPWLDDAGHTGFEGLPGEGWTLGQDGYYYYAYPVTPGESPKPLFDTYTPPVAPVAGSHLEMSIMTQAVVWDEDMVNAKEAWGVTAAGLLEPAPQTAAGL